MSELALENEIPYKQKKGKKVLIISIVAVLILGIIAYFVYTKTSAQSNTAAQVQYVTVKKGDVVETVSASGTVAAAQQLSLNGDSTSKVTAINVKVGDQVKAGQVLATLDDTDAKSKLSSAQANLTVAQAKLSQVQQGTATSADIAAQQVSIDKAQIAVDGAQQKYNDAQAQFDAKKITQSDLNQALNALKSAQADYNLAQVKMTQLKAPPKDSDVQTAKAAVDQASSALQQQQVALDKLSVKAPIDGTIVQVNGAIGDTSTNGKALIVMDNADMSQLKITAQISQSDISKVQNDMKATITTSAVDNKTFNGKVTSVAPEATTTSGVTTYDVTLSVDNTDNLLKPGMTTNVTVEVGNHQGVLYVPSMALKNRGGKDGVYVQNTNGSTSSDTSQTGTGQNSKRGQNAGIPSNLKFQAVTVGYYATDKVEITSGLKEGDSVAIILSVPSTNSTRTTNGTSAFSGLSGGNSFGGGGSGNRSSGGSGTSGGGGTSSSSRGGN
ncbi:efflux RND transporter periplasmic adaptor subunit [Ectobacillus sp. sgz5001026]|uniref:efflux RND transporter periplasmic adaptor subunit n=1 Tax=Ectobacillus sp. sgz5001026 TaxID=3242473 RepID=UPI0036D31055